MGQNRLMRHPILPIKEKKEVLFYFNGTPYRAHEDEMIASALFANGISIFGHHHVDKSAQGIFCANGQCAKCSVIANGIPVKSCMTKVKPNMMVQSVEGLPELPNLTEHYEFGAIEEYTCDVLIVGGGPAGLSAALQLKDYGIKTILIDDKAELGGKLILQTHKFFGSVADSFAGTRGIEIGYNLGKEVEKSITTWTNSTALFVFKDKKVGVLCEGEYRLVTPKVILNAAGAREKMIRFQGNTLVGVYGAGAFQTLVNRDLIKPTDRLFIVGGGNVGLIAGYHALQAGIEVSGLVEALPVCGGYKVHADKLKRLGVPIYTSHTILSANGDERVSSVTIAKIDDKFNPIAGTEKSFACDTVLIAVGLESLNEFTEEATKSGIPVFAAGDAYEIAEASSAMFNGKITGLKVAAFLGADVGEIPQSLYEKAEILKSHPGKVFPAQYQSKEEGVMPVIHCFQEIPCNPCTSVCPTNAIQIKEDEIMGLPCYDGKCIGCHKCVLVCPGLAITLVDYRKDNDYPLVSIPYEISNLPVQIRDKVKAVDYEGNYLADLEVMAVIDNKERKTQLIKLSAPRAIAKKIASFTVQEKEVSEPLPQTVMPTKTPDDAMVCLCERVSAKDVRALIKKGIVDINQIKAVTRAGMGPCGSKTCDNMIKQIMRQEGIYEPVDNTRRPVFVEVPLGILAGTKGEA